MSKFIGYATAWRGCDGRINLKDGPYTLDQAKALIYADKLRHSNLDYLILEIHEPDAAPEAGEAMRLGTETAPEKETVCR